MDIQICNCCGFAKSLIDYEWQENRPSPRKTCKDCRYKMRDADKERERHRVYSRARYWSDTVAARQRWERTVYGACKEDIGELKCRICNGTERLCIDHCHTTNNVRGILCTKCNAGLGMFRDNPELLYKAAEYLDMPHFQLEK